MTDLENRLDYYRGKESENIVKRNKLKEDIRKLTELNEDLMRENKKLSVALAKSHQALCQECLYENTSEPYCINCSDYSNFINN